MAADWRRGGRGGDATGPAPPHPPRPARVGPPLSPITAPTQSFFRLKESGGSWKPAPTGCWTPEWPLQPPPPPVFWPPRPPWLGSCSGLLSGARGSAAPRREATTQKEALAPASGRDMAPRTGSGTSDVFRQALHTRDAVEGWSTRAATQPLLKAPARRRPAQAAAHWRTRRCERDWSNGLPPSCTPCILPARLSESLRGPCPSLLWAVRASLCFPATHPLLGPASQGRRRRSYV